MPDHDKQRQIDLRLRHARDEDVFAFYRWWKDKETQRFNGTPTMTLTWDQHITWFAANIVSPHWYVGEIEAWRETRRDSMFAPNGRTWDLHTYDAVGAMRYDLGEDAAWWVSIVMAPEHRGKGYGTCMLTQPACGLEEVTAWARIHQFNVPSVKAFEKAGYVLDHEESPWLIYRRSHRT